jgi:hypothetical protein
MSSRKRFLVQRTFLKFLTQHFLLGTNQGGASGSHYLGKTA